MHQQELTNWEELIQHVAHRWTMSPDYASEQMVSVVRHAIFDPALTLVISTSGLMKMSLVPEASTYDWICMCQEVSRKWLHQYRMTEHHCVHQTDDVKDACYCILSQIGPLFADSTQLFEMGISLIHQLPTAEYDEAYDMLLRALARLSRVSRELTKQDLAWLWSYINDKTY